VKKIITVVGARPQFIKASVVSRKLRETGFNEKIVHTGQHYDFNMSDVFFQELNIPKPDYFLEVGSGTHGEMTGKMLIQIEKVLLAEKPEMVLVYGDTNTTLAGALAASKLHIPIAHVEAGLRSFNKKMPEEINRILTDNISSILFCPTETAVNNLVKEGYKISENHNPYVANVGDVMFDVALEIYDRVEYKTSEVLNKYHLESEKYLLVTIHRADNTDNENNLRNIWEALIKLAESGKTVFFPVHPRTRKCLEQYGLLKRTLPENLILTEPVPYTEIIILEKNAKIVLTDSGGVQKESYFFKTPTVVVRSETEWVELIETGWAKLAGKNEVEIINRVNSIWENEILGKYESFFGNGKGAIKISDKLRNIL
jgi:UDP-N-acetylglucosamine 2-epimerase